ncbi:MAG: efflux RND transporter periplasmic adaptor subunit [Deltaproteobacteria bacterium]|nr:efflux RND transporter periplasmic adaptor subunit [Deltaproteobacteria bacterium]
MTAVGRLTAFALFSLAVAAVAVPRILSSDSRAGRQDSQSSTPPPPRAPTVIVHTVRPEQLVERLATTGTLRANEQVEISSELSGKVAQLRFQEGSPVARGQVLLKIEAGELETQRQRALHRVELARRREAREQKLVADGLISSQEYDFARTNLDVLESELALVDAQLEKTEIRAPFSGIVGLRFISPGAYVTPQTRIASLQDLDPMKVDFSVPERYASRVQLGQRLDLQVAGLEERFEAEIYAIEPSVEATTRSLVVRARLQNRQGFLRPGAFADISVIIARIEEALTVPSVAIIPELGGKKVLIVEDGIVASRPVETGIRTEATVEITAGLNANDQVIIRGLEAVNVGTVVDARSDTGSPGAH